MSRRDSHLNKRPRDSRSSQDRNPSPARPQPTHVRPFAPRPALPPPAYVQPNPPRRAEPPPAQLAHITPGPAPTPPPGPSRLNADPLRNRRHGNAQVPLQPFTGMGLERFAPFVGGPTVTDMNPTQFNTQRYAPNPWEVRPEMITPDPYPDPPGASITTFLNEEILDIDHELQGVPSMEALLDMGAQRAEATFVEEGREQNLD
ncbi:MAG: hypothetical protein Q9173_002565 [Seirophora scorigena]